MRTRTPEPELLEPLPVEIGGVTIAPEAAAPEYTDRVPMPTAREVVDAIRATINEAPSLRGQSPWSQPSAIDMSTTRNLHRVAAFSRMLALPPARLDALPEWWTRSARDGGVEEFARRLTVGAPTKRAAETWCMRGRLRSPWRARSIPVDVVLWPHLGMWTKLHVEPQRGVRVGRRYFRGGHRVLDVLTHRLILEL